MNSVFEKLNRNNPLRNVSVIFIIFMILQLSKFWIINYISIVLIFFIFFKYCKFAYHELTFALLLSTALIYTFLFVKNPFLLIYAMTIIGYILLKSTLSVFFSKINNLNLCLAIIFYCICIFNILCYLVPELNNAARAVFSYSGGSEFRITGFIQGYEFVPYILLTYAAYEYELNGRNFSKKSLINTCLAILVSTLSGRYAMVTIFIYILYIIITSKKPMAIISISAIVYIILHMFDPIRLGNITDTIEVAFNIMLNFNISGIEIREGDFTSMSEIDGQYNLSPVTWVNELIYPLSNITENFFPSLNVNQVDPGPSLLILNLGIIFTYCIYHFFWYSINRTTRKKIPLIIILLVMATDIKYKTLFSLMPMTWIFALHINHSIQANKL
jgi:hypothetical protein